MEALKMETPMDRWNDDRLDELSRRMDEGFKEIKADMKEGFARMDQRFAQVDQKFERLLHTLVLIAWGFAGATVAALAAVLVAALS